MYTPVYRQWLCGCGLSIGSRGAGADYSSMRHCLNVQVLHILAVLLVAV